MKIGAVLGFVAGGGLAAWLLASYGVGRVLDLIAHAGPAGLAGVIGIHLLQVLFSAAAWRSIAGPTRPQPGYGAYVVLRWVREAANNLLPVAQIGGEFIAARLLARRGVPLTAAIAGAVCDLTIEIVTQIAFTLLGLGLLLHRGGGGADADVANAVTGGLVVAALAGGGFLAAQWLGLARLIEAGLLRVGRMTGWGGFGGVRGLHEALTGLYRDPRRVLASLCCHLVSWVLGGAEVWLALHVLGRDVGPSAALVIESLGQALKAAAFAVPGALGVQEGGLIVVCGLFGLPPDLAIALSLTKRLREVALGVPGLAAWRWLQSASPATAVAEMGR